MTILNTKLIINFWYPDDNDISIQCLFVSYKISKSSSIFILILDSSNKILALSSILG